MTSKPFKAAWWLQNSHFQTIWPVFVRRSVSLQLSRERFELPDGDFVDLDWVNRDQDAPLVLVLHGLEGSIDSHYSRGMLKSIADRGWRAVFMHFRGCSGEPNRLPQGYHSGETDDVGYVIRVLCQRFPHNDLAAIGYSLGGNVLLKWLGETAWQNPLKAAIAISVPFELQKTALRAQTGFSRIYQWYLLRCLRMRLNVQLRAVQALPFDPDIINQVNSMYEFDDKITAPLHGFDGVEDYYNKSSSRYFLKRIRTPTLILHAKDDPFMFEDVIPQHQEVSNHVTLEVSENGGHVGFITGNYPWKPIYWLEERVPEYLKMYLKK